MRIPVLLSSGIVLLAGITLAGCATWAANRITIMPQETAQISIHNSRLQDDCEIVTGRGLYEDEIMLGAVDLRSLEGEKRTFEYRWRWYDSDGITQGSSTSSWKTMFINSMEEKQITGRATRRGAEKAVFEIRYHSGVTHADN